MKLIRIISKYGEEFIRKEIKRENKGVYTDKGYVPFEDISFIDIIGEVVENKNENKR